MSRIESYQRLASIKAHPLIQRSDLIFAENSIQDGVDEV